MLIDENKNRIEILKKMLAVAKSLANSETSEVYELGHYIADNVLSKVCMLVGKEKKREDLVYTNDNSNRTKRFKALYKGILEFFFPSLPKYSDFVQKYHRDRNIYQHGLEHLDLKTIKKPSAMDYIEFVENIMRKVGYLGKAEAIDPFNLISGYTFNAGDHQKSKLENQFKNFYNRLASDDLEHIFVDIKTILDEIGNRNLRKVLKMEYRTLRYGDSMLAEHYKWNLDLNHGYRKNLSISKHNEGTYNFIEPQKNREILFEFLKIIKGRCKDAGLYIT